MVKYCPDCGSSVDDFALFCPNCNTKIEEEIISSKKDSEYTLHPTDHSKKTHRKLIMVVVSILIIVGIIIGVAMLFLFRDDTSRFYGTWNAEQNLSQSGSSAIWTFYENGSLKMENSYSYSSNNIEFDEDEENNTLTVTEIGGSSSTQWCNYEAKGGKLRLEYSTSGSYTPAFEISYNFVNDNKITLSVYGYSITLTRTTKASTDYSTEPEFRWEDINISVDLGYGYNSETIHWDWINLTRSSIPYYGEHAPSEWGKVNIGDVIEAGKYDSYVSGQVTWYPEGSHIDYFYFWNT